MASVQFYGMEKAIEAYEKQNIPAVAIFSGRQIIFRYGGSSITEGSALLEEFLTAIEHSNATYTLKVYEQTAKPGKAAGSIPDLRIKEKTECDLSFNFKIVPEEQYQARMIERGFYPGGSSSGGNKAILDKLDGLQNEIAEIKAARMNGLDDQDDHQDQPETFNDILMGLLKEPAKIGQLINIGKSLLNGSPMPAMQTSPAMIGNHEKITDENISSVDNNLEKLSAALDILEKSDPKIVDHLVKLSQISQSNPTLFKMLITNLDSL